MRAARLPDVASLSWGLPSFRTPGHIRDAVARALSEDPDIGKYTLPDGLPALRDLVVETHLRKTGMRVSADDNVFITAGNMQGMSSVLHALIEPGDEIVLTDPGFASHSQQVRLRGGVPVYWPLEERDGWRLDVGALAGLITARTKAIVLVNPLNPTGSVFGRQDLDALGRVVLERNLMLILDDPYSELVFDESPGYYNAASNPALSDNIAYLFTFSKIHAMSGWRLGYMVVPPWLRRAVLKIHDANMICTPRISQTAGIAALSGSQEHVREFRAILGERRQLICDRLDALPHVFRYVRPAGAYYVFPRIVTAHRDSWTFALSLLDEARVAVTPGVAFGPGSDHHVRLAFCVAEDEINRAFDRLQARFPG